MSELMGIAPFALLLVAGLVIMIFDALWGPLEELPFATASALFAAAAISFLLLSEGGAPELPAYMSSYIAADKLGLFFDIVICAGAGLSVLLAGGYLKEHELERGEFYVLVLFSAFGAMVLARSVDLLTLFLGLETMSFGAYALVAFRRTSARAAEGAVKYFLLGSFAAAILLFGSALLYGATGHTNLEAIATAISSGNADTMLTLLATAMLTVGLAFKVSAVPFHMWTPDAYEGAATPATTFMSVAVKAAGFAIIIRVLAGAFGDPVSMSSSTGWTPVVAVLALITMVYGNVAAIAQSSVKRMLAYSSIAHAGYALVGVCAIHKLPETAVSAVLFYMLAYTASNVLAFGSLILIGSKGKEAVSYEDLAGVGTRHPVVASLMVLAMLSLIGIPPTAGFFAKYYVFSAAVQAGGFMIVLAVVGVLTSAVAAYYYIKVVVYMFMRDPAEDAPIAVPMRSWYVYAALVTAGYYVLKLGIFPSKYLQFAVDAASQFVG